MPWQASGGVQGGFLALTYSQTHQESVVILPELDPSLDVAGFLFECQIRAGNPYGPPADGFSLSFARLDDPVVLNPASSRGFPSSPFESFLEQGTTTGLAISFDSYRGNPLPDGSDLRGVIVRVNNKTIYQTPLDTINGDCADPTSLQTGPSDQAYWVANGSPTAPGSWASLCWQPLTVRLATDGTLTVHWKGQIIIDALQTGYKSAPGRLVMAGRNGGANQHVHVDNLRFETFAPVVSPAGFVRGMVRLNQWTNQTGDFSTFASQKLGSQPPSVQDLRNSFSSTFELGEQYFGQLIGWFTPTNTDSYVFLCSSDDASELYLSTDDSPAHKVKIAGVPGWTPDREWNKYPEQKSAPVLLTAGRQYYLELVWKEDFGGDHGSVAVKRASEADPLNGQGQLSGDRIGTYLAGYAPLNLRITQVASNNATLTWSGGYGPVLQSSLSVTGPFSDVAGASSPLTVSMREAARFFRLKDSPQTFSPVVGFANINVVAGDNLLNNPFNRGANNAATVLGSVPDGTVIFSYASGVYSHNVKFLGRFTDPNATYPPGKAFFLRSPQAFTLNLAGEVSQGKLSMDLIKGLNLVGSMVPQAGRISADLKYPAYEGTVLNQFSAGPGRYLAPNGYDFGDWSLGDPVISIGEGFFVNQSAAAKWERTFSTQP